MAAAPGFATHLTPLPLHQVAPLAGVPGLLPTPVIGDSLLNRFVAPRPLVAGAPLLNRNLLTPVTDPFAPGVVPSSLPVISRFSEPSTVFPGPLPIADRLAYPGSLQFTDRFAYPGSLPITDRYAYPLPAPYTDRLTYPGLTYLNRFGGLPDVYSPLPVDRFPGLNTPLPVYPNIPLSRVGLNSPIIPSIPTPTIPTPFVPPTTLASPFVVNVEENREEPITKDLPIVEPIVERKDEIVVEKVIEPEIIGDSKYSHG